LKTISFQDSKSATKKFIEVTKAVTLFYPDSSRLFNLKIDESGLQLGSVIMQDAKSIVTTFSLVSNFSSKVVYKHWMRKGNIIQFLIPARSKGIQDYAPRLPNHTLN
jgi:hypothetical protein